jgi:hypothetical protein
LDWQQLTHQRAMVEGALNSELSFAERWVQRATLRHPVQRSQSFRAPVAAVSRFQFGSRSRFEPMYFQGGLPTLRGGHLST